MNVKKCRFCSTSLKHSFCDLGLTPLSNTYLSELDLKKKEPFYPLHAYVCELCYLVQLEEFETPENIFSDYAYFSSYSDSWLKHAKQYTDLMTQRFGFNKSNLVIEIASNDGYLLKYFKEKNIPILGIEPAANVAKVAQQAGIPTLIKFFGTQTARELVQEGKQADLLLGNNVLAHVPNLNDFVSGMSTVLKPNGVITMEFPHLLRLMEENQFDTIYHEHFSYFSFLTVEKVFAKHGLTIFDVDELPTHGGSLRIYAKHKENQLPAMQTTKRVVDLKMKEKDFGLDDIEIYKAFTRKVQKTRESLIHFLKEAQRRKQSVVGYGAPAKGNTLLNFCGISKELLDYTVDRSPHKQGRYLPGTRIPILAPEAIRKTKPAFVLILPWNLREEISHQMSFIKEWGGKFVVPIPEVKVLD